jgi:hypothetical protein
MAVVPSSTIIHDDEQMLHKPDEFLGEVLFDTNRILGSIILSTPQSYRPAGLVAPTQRQFASPIRLEEETLRACAVLDPTDRTYVR